MSSEEMNKKMEFIVEQQAQFAADIQVMREVHAQDAMMLTEQYRKLSEAMIGLVAFFGNLTEAQTRTEERINLLARNTEEGISQLAQAQGRTEERLNIIISIVERYFGGNGPAESPA